MLPFQSFNCQIPIKGKRRAKMFTKFTLTMITIILLTTLTGCSSTTTSNASDTYPGPTDTADEYQMLPIISVNVTNLMLDASADGSTQQLTKGQVMSITLESNPSTGYSWFATSSNPDVLVQMGEPEYQAPASDSTNPIVGAAGAETYYFQAADTGTATLTLDYKRSWETDVNPEKTITITVEVK
jgi:inhibitor of cysteine peptidase